MGVPSCGGGSLEERDVPTDPGSVASGSTFAEIAAAAPVAIVMVDVDGHVLFTNRLFESVFGYGHDEIHGQSVEVLIPEAARATHASLRDAFMTSPQTRTMGRGQELFARRKNGSEFPVEVGLTPIRGPRGPAMIATIVDITDRKLAEQAAHEGEALYGALIEGMRDGVAVIQDAKLVLTNSAMAAMSGRSPEAVASQPFTDFLAPEFVRPMLARYELRMQEDVEPPSTSEARLRLPDGSPGNWVEIKSRRIAYHGRPAALVVLRDITERKATAERLEILAATDELTGLANRAKLLDRLDLALTAARRHKTLVGLLYLDLDEFKPINDTEGHLAGDEVLREVSNRLQRVVRETDTVGRMGGDEFVVLLTDLTRPVDATTVANKVVRALAEPVAIGGKALRVGVSVGVALYPTDGSDASALLTRADQALYAAKAAGKNRWVSTSDLT